MRGEYWDPHTDATHGFEEQSEDSYDESQSDHCEPDDTNHTTVEKGKEDDFKTRLQGCLEDVLHDGTFSSFQSIEAYINPGLHINGIGTVGLPLSNRDAQALAHVSKRSPFGKGDATVIDETVRKTWELDATEFECRNPAWMPYLETLKNHAVQDLGVKVAAYAQPYKILLYEEGAFFKAHRDTEKVPGMFGTLIISLPSEHTGGQVHLLHSGKQHVIDTAASSAFGLSALAWYSDVQHEIKPVTSGYRLVLSYNLVQDMTVPKQTAAAVDASHAKLEKLLLTWKTSLPQFDFFVYPLEHQYTETSLSLRNLKGGDAAKGRYLERVCSQNGFYWLLSRMTKSTQDYGYEDYHDDEDEEYVRLGNIVTPLGKTIPLSIENIDENHLLADSEDLYGNRSADSEDEGEYTGNENMPSQFRYHNTVVLLLRRDYVISSFTRNIRQSLESMLNMFELVRDDVHCPGDMRRKVSKAILEETWGVIAKRDDDSRSVWSYGFNPLGYGVEREKKRAEYAEVFQTVAEHCYANNEGHTVSEVLQRTTSDTTWANSNVLVQLVSNQIARETADDGDGAWNRWLSTPLPPVPTYKYVNERRRVFETVQKTLPPATIPSFVDWCNREVLKLLRRVKSYSMEDAEPLVQLIRVVAPETYHKDILSILANKPHRAGLSRFLHHLGTTAVSDESLCVNIVIPTYRRLIPISSQLLKLQFDDLAKPKHLQYVAQPATDIEISTSVQEVIEIIDQSMKLSLTNEAVDLLTQCLPILPQAHEPAWGKWRHVFLFINVVIELLQRHSHAPLTACASQWIAEALHAASMYVASTRPTKPRDWTRPHVRREKCDCGPCVSVKHFLMNPSQPSGRFSYAEKIRKHIEYSFMSHDDFKFETEKRNSPYTLVIHKTNNQYTRALKEWENDKIDLQRQVQNMKSEFLDNMLGDDMVAITRNGRADVAFAGAHGGARDDQVPSLQPLSASRQNLATAYLPSLSTVQKPHIIDLTEESF